MILVHHIETIDGQWEELQADMPELDDQLDALLDGWPEGEPLEPVPFASRMDSPLWDSLTRLPEPRRRKLTAEQVQDIRALHREGMPMRTIADLFWVSPSTVHDVVHRYRYADVEDVPA